MDGNFLGTTVVGSYPQPDWLIDREALTHAGVPRVRHAELWRIPEAHLESAQEDATLLAIREMERAGVTQFPQLLILARSEHQSRTHSV